MTSEIADNLLFVMQWHDEAPIEELEKVEQAMEWTFPRKELRMAYDVACANPSYVRRILDISTVHISQETGQLLDHWATTEKPRPAIVFNKDHYGWLVYVPSETNHEALPADLHACMDLARSHDCDWIMFDCDGVDIDELPVYEW